LLDGKGKLVMSLEGCFEVSKALSDLQRDSIFPRHKENQVYNAIYKVDKKFKLVVPNSISEHRYILVRNY
jgi:hypothetical protein